jgi:hypothetical protein
MPEIIFSEQLAFAPSHIIPTVLAKTFFRERYTLRESPPSR